MDDELEHSPWSWLDNFTQQFSWCRPSVRASPFLNNYFLPGVYILTIFPYFVFQPVFKLRTANGAMLLLWTLSKMLEKSLAKQKIR